ncbi:MAG: (Fe-S)-binding protein [Rhodospirillaceae bacterium]|nr:(Fe-S)-binding protein [Rhodospirillaceae bacterium]MCY4238708.1 (Fe-S)-binding protein [Rhodospirillaceae bacterium]
MSAERPTVALFVTCLVDLFRPSVGFAAVKLLEQAGCKVKVPASQTCCGQPGYNSGDRCAAQAVAREVIKAFEDFDAVVTPSGSCGGMIAKHYPELFSDDPAWSDRAGRLAAKTHELVGYLVDVRGLAGVDVRLERIATYHDSCSSLREMQVKTQPRGLLASVDRLALRELETPETCCGFGGTFCVKYPDVSNAMVEDKVADVIQTGADTVLAGDMGCLLNIAGKLSREGSAIQAYHVAEVLAGIDAPPIAWSGGSEGEA